MTMSSSNHNNTVNIVSKVGNVKAKESKDKTKKENTKEKTKGKSEPKKKSVRKMMNSDTESSEESEEDSDEELTMEVKMNYFQSEAKKFRKKWQEALYKNEMLTKEFTENRILLNEMSLSCKEMNVETPDLNIVNNIGFNELIMDVEASKDMALEAKAEYLKLKGFLVQKKYEEIQEETLISNMKKMKSNPDKMMLINTNKEVAKIMHSNLSARCNCSWCFETKINSLEKMTEKTTLDLSMFNKKSIKLEYETGTHKVFFKNLETGESTVEVSSVQFKKSPIKLTFTSEYKERMSWKKELPLSVFSMLVPTLNKTYNVYGRAYFFVKNIRSWMNNVDCLKMENYWENLMPEVNPKGFCFLEVFCEVLNITDVSSKAELIHNREFRSISNLSFEEEVAFISGLWSKKVYVFSNKDDVFDKNNHISLKPGKNLLEMDPIRIINPICRNIRYFSNVEDILDAVNTESHWDDYMVPEPDVCVDIEDDVMSMIDTDDDESNIIDMIDHNSLLEDVAPILSKEAESYSFEKKMEHLQRVYNAKMLKYMYNSLKRLYMLVDYNPMPTSTICMAPNPFVKSVVTKKMENKGMPNHMLNLWADHSMINHISTLNYEHYTPNYYFLLTTTLKEFSLIAFFWSDLYSFSDNIMLKDLSFFSQAKENLPKYFNMLTKKGMMLDTTEDTTEEKIDKMYEVISSSAFMDTKSSTIRRLFIFFHLRVMYAILMQNMVKSTTQDINSMSWKDVRENTLINLNVTGNKDSWYNMFRTRASERSVKFIDAYRPSVTDIWLTSDDHIYKSKSMNYFNTMEEFKITMCLYIFFDFTKKWADSL
jgi:hypothetical protein